VPKMLAAAIAGAGDGPDIDQWTFIASMAP
jgi:hypothetical protein